MAIPGFDDILRAAQRSALHLETRDTYADTDLTSQRGRLASRTIVAIVTPSGARSSGRLSAVE